MTIGLAVALGLSVGVPNAPSQPAQVPLVFVRTEVDSDRFQPLSARVVNGVVPPRFNSRGPLEVVSLDSDDRVLASYRRGDVRVAIGESPAGSGPSPDGRPVSFSVNVLEGLRRIRVLGPADQVLLDVDLGPALVDACRDGTLEASLCATFDSDGDGCRDLEDPDPLTPETELPELTVSASPDRLWPANHRLVDVKIAIEVSDNCTADPEVLFIEARSSDPEAGVTPADVAPQKAPDIVDAAIGTTDVELRLRAERWPQVAGSRVYTLTYRAADRAGNQTVATTAVVVPKTPR
jgi:hypothetical protein